MVLKGLRAVILVLRSKVDILSKVVIPSKEAIRANLVRPLVLANLAPLVSTLASLVHLVSTQVNLAPLVSTLASLVHLVSTQVSLAPLVSILANLALLANTLVNLVLLASILDSLVLLQATANLANLVSLGSLPKDSSSQTGRRTYTIKFLLKRFSAFSNGSLAWIAIVLALSPPLSLLKSSLAASPSVSSPRRSSLRCLIAITVARLISVSTHH